jgi:hypothetical protein
VCAIATVAEFLADQMVNYAFMISLPVLKPICFAVVMACAVACAPSHHDNSGGSAAAATTNAAAPQPGGQMTAQTAAERIKAAIPEVKLITIGKRLTNMPALATHPRRAFWSPDDAQVV